MEKTKTEQILPLIKVQTERDSIQELVQEIERIANLYFAKLTQQVMKGKQATKLGPVKENSVIIARLAVASAQHLGEETERTIRTDKDVVEIIHRAAGLDAIKVWLKNQGRKADSILEASGKSWLYSSLLALEYNQNTFGFYKTFDRFKEVAGELYDWFQIVNILNRESGMRVRFSFLAQNVADVVWRMDRVYLTLIIFLTLPAAKAKQATFSFSEIGSFCKAVRKPEWIRNITAGLESFRFEDTNKTLADNVLIKHFLEQLQIKENQNAFYFINKVSIQSEHHLLKVRRTIENAVRMVRKAQTLATAEEKKAEVETTTKQISSILWGHSLIWVHAFLLEYPYLTSWLSDDLRLSLGAVDAYTGNKLAIAARPYGQEDAFQAVTARLSEKVSIGEMIISSMSGKDPIPFTLIRKSMNSEKHRAKAGHSVSNADVYDVLINRIADLLHLETFYGWLQMAEQGNTYVPLNPVPLAYVIAIYFLRGVENAPRSAKAVVESHQSWAPYLDEYAVAYFQKTMPKGNL